MAGLLALMLLHHARLAACRAADGCLVPLPDQDPGLWDTSLIREGVGILQAALAAGRLGEYQAAIAAVHDDAATAAETDWPQIPEWYEELLRFNDNPVVSLNPCLLQTVHPSGRCRSHRYPFANSTFFNVEELVLSNGDHHFRGNLM